MIETKILPTAIVLAVAFSLPAASWAALDVRPPEIEVTRHELSNGLEVLMHRDTSVPVVNVQVWYHVGSKDEREGRTGFAHLFEHIMFKGSDNVPDEAYGPFIQDIGGRYNATTDFDRTLYFQTVPSNYLERILWMEADRMRSLRVVEASFHSERDVVKEERRVRYENAPYGLLFETIFDAIFTTHPYRHTPIGSMGDLNAATIDDVKEFHTTYYVPRNATLVISGDFDPKTALGWVKTYFGEIPAGDPIPRDLPTEPPQTEERRVVRYDANAPLPAVVFAYRAPEAGHEDSYALQVAGNILSIGQSSRLYKKLVYDQQIAVQASGQVLPLEDAGVFFFFAILNQGQEPDAGETSLLEEVERLKNEPVSAEELEKAKNQFISQQVQSRQTVQAKGSAIGYAAVILDDLDAVNEQVARFQAVSAEDIQRVASKYFRDTNRTTLLMLPETLRPADESNTETETAEGR